MSGIHDLEQLLRDHPFARDMPDACIHEMSGCAENVRFREGAYLFREGENAETFFLIRAGSVVMELNAPPRGTLQIDSRKTGDTLGWSWIVEPYRWFCDARAVDEVRALAFNAVCLRDKLERDPVFASEMYRRFVPLIYRGLHATQLQLLDVYGGN